MAQPEQQQAVTSSTDSSSSISGFGSSHSVSNQLLKSRQHNVQALFHRLPIELIEKVFITGLPVWHLPPMEKWKLGTIEYMLSISGVCSHWRAISVINPIVRKLVLVIDCFCVNRCVSPSYGPQSSC